MRFESVELREEVKDFSPQGGTEDHRGKWRLIDVDVFEALSQVGKLPVRLELSFLLQSSQIP